MLEEYVEYIKYLHRDVRGLISDIELSRSGGQIEYLVDASEISAYVLPDDSSPVALLEDQSATGRAISFELMTLILFGRRDAPLQPLGRRLLLLPPYIAEVEALAHRVSERSMHRITELRDERERAAILSEAENFTTTQEFAEVERFLASDTIDETSLNAIDAVMRQRAAHLLRLTETDEPLARLNDVLGSGRIQQFRTVYRDVDMHAETADRWFDRLMSLPMPARDVKRVHQGRRFDSVAMGYVYGALRHHGGNARIRLITRSGDMQRVMSMDEARWDGVGGSPLRHPRAFVALVVATAVGGESGAIEHLRRLADSLEVFVLAQRNAGDTSADADAQFRKLQQEWRDSAELAFSITDAQLTNRAANKTVERMREVFRLAIDRVALRDQIASSIAQISSSVSRSFQLLGFMTQGTRETKRQIAGALELSEGHQGATVLAATVNWMPYSIELFGARMQEFRHRHAKIDSWNGLGRFLAEWLSEGRQGEPLLAIAYLTGALGHWAAAEKYAELALRECTPNERTHEVKFILAVCKRKHNASATRLHRGLELIDDAIEEKRAFAGSDYRDPRYVKERAVIMFEILNAYPQNAAETGVTLKEAIELSHEVLAHADADEYLKVQVYNNLCWQMLQRPDTTDPTLLQSWLADLIRHQADLQPERRTWSPSIRDTIAWARWTLGETHGASLSITEIAELLQEYREIVEAAEHQPDVGDFVTRMRIIANAVQARDLK